MIVERRFTGNAEIIPFGVNAIVTSTGIGENSNKIVIVAVPDGDFETTAQAFDRAMELEGPSWILNFESIQSIDGFIDQLKLAKSNMKKCGFT